MDNISDLRELLKKPEDQNSSVGTELDTTINFRVNGELKKKFEAICKSNHSTISQELKKYMSKILANGKFR